jgi:acetoin utilization deacetylase AcuC-like enzyme
MIIKIPVFYRSEVVPVSRFFSPGTYKPEEVTRDWISHGLPINVISFEPVSRDALYRAHAKSYVDGVLDCHLANGFGGMQPDVAISLPFTTGAMLAAAREALVNSQVACAPVAGFHHAHYSSPGGFCTFNGLMVTALTLLALGEAKRIGILDLDQHYGDGTDDILAAVGPVAVVHTTAGARKRTAKDAESFLSRLPDTVEAFTDCDVLLYQAGADPHVKDPLGGWMTTEQMMRRDKIVFEGAQRIGVPIAWNLAGGYQRDDQGGIGPVLEIHRNTMIECARVFTKSN